MRQGDSWGEKKLALADSNKQISLQIMGDDSHIVICILNQFLLILGWS